MSLRITSAAVSCIRGRRLPAVIIILILLFWSSIPAECSGRIDITDCSITLAYTEFIIDGTVHTPAVTVKYKGRKLTKNKDYTLKYDTYVWTEKPSKVTITGTGSYGGSTFRMYYGRKKDKKTPAVYTVKFNANGGRGKMKAQKIRRGSRIRLKSCSFKRDGYEFAGWAVKKNRSKVYMDKYQIGKIRFKNRSKVKNLAKSGKSITLYAVWKGAGPQAAADWAVRIARDNSFTYGRKPVTNRVGCYFCGTNRRNKPKGYEKTYVCLTFVTAAYAHGAQDKAILRMDRSGRYCLSSTDSNLHKLKCWKMVGRCRRLKVSDLKTGDVIIWWSGDNRHGHMSMYIGHGNIVDASGGGWDAGSIAVRKGKAASYLRIGARHDRRSYVMRYKRK